MKAALLTAPNEIRLADIATPRAGPGELLVRTRAATICGTDLRIFRGRKSKGVRFPSVIGHEFAGEIVEVGAGVTQFRIGGRIAVNPVVPCRRCAYCKVGQENVCLNRRAIGYEFDGAFAEFVRIPAIALEAGNVHAIPDHISFEAAALAEPLACCLNGQRNADIRLGDDVLILGGGPIGLMHAKLASLAGARSVSISEPNAARRERAAGMGFDRLIDPTAQDPGAAMRDMTDGLGASVVIVAIGIPTLANDALGYARKGGRVNLFAGFSAGDMASFDVNLVHYNELVVTGASALTRRGYETALSLLADGRIDAAALITNRLRLPDLGEALALAESGAALKVAITDV